MRRALPAFLMLMLASAMARSEEWPAPELRLGLVAHDVGGAEAGFASFAGDVLFALPWREKAGAAAPFLPRLHLGAIVNGAGRTSLAHAGLTWQVEIGGGVFAEAGAGLATHDGPTGLASRPGHAAMGCRLLFRESLGLGYRLGGGWSVIAAVEHVSNGGFCTRNRGLTHLGMRVGYQF